MIDALEGEPAWNELNDVTHGYEAGPAAISCSAMLETMRSPGRATTTHDRGCGSDRFEGGSGTHVIIDFNAGEGDTQSEVP